MTYAYPLAVDTWGEEERQAAARVIASGRYTMGAEVEALEEEFARHIGVKHAVMVNSGSAANLLAVASLALEPSSIAVSPLSWPTTLWPMLRYGHRLRFVDVRADTMCMQAFFGGFGAVCFTHVLSYSSEVIHFRGATLIEDRCEALDTDRGAGISGRAATFSFYFAHHINTAEGGMVVTDEDPRPYRSMRAHGWTRGIYPTVPGLDPRFTFIGEGYNLKPTDIQAAIGRVQLRRLPGMLSGRREGAHRIAEMLPEWLVTQTPRAWMMFPMRLRDDAPASRADVVGILESAGVETRPIIAGNLLRHPAFSHYKAHTPNADIIHERGLMIGCPPHVSDEGLDALGRAMAKLRAL